jgi:hypothetical protein
MTDVADVRARAPVSIGRIVHYTLDEGRNRGEIRPAIVVRVWGPDHPSVQLQVFTDTGSDLAYNDELPQVMWKTSVEESRSGGSEFGRWHWPIREGA